MTGLTTFLQTCFQADCVERMGWTLIHSLWQIAAVTAVYAIVALTLRNRSAPSRYLAGCAAMLLMLGLPMLTYAVLPAAASAPHAAAAREPTEFVPLPAVDWPAPEGGDLAVSGPVRPEQPASPLEAAQAEPVVSTDRQPTFLFGLSAWLQPWVCWFTAAWLVGVFLFAFRPMWGWLHVRRLQRQGLSPLADPIRRMCDDLMQKLGVRRAVQFAQSTLVKVPTVVGHLRPLVLLPASAISGLSTTEIELIIAHELAHVRRHDYLVNLAQTVVEAVLFFHPGVWWVSRQIRHERENCCDDLAVQHCGNRLVYARTLVRLAENRTFAPSAAVAASGGSLLDRVCRIVGQPGSAHTPRATWFASALVIVAVSAAFSIAMVVDSGELSKPSDSNGPIQETSNAQPESQSDREAMLAFARALAAGDFDALEQFWLFEDDLDRQFGRKIAAMCARAQDMSVELLTLQRLSEDSLCACFLTRNGPDGFGLDPAPVVVEFRLDQGRWRCALPGNVWSMLDARSGVDGERIRRRTIAQRLIAVRFGEKDFDLDQQMAVTKAQADAYERVAGPPYNLSRFERIAEVLRESVRKQEEKLQSWQGRRPSREDLARWVLEEEGEDARPRPDDSCLCFYLEGDKDDPGVRELPFAGEEGPFLAEPFPCLTEQMVLGASLGQDSARNAPLVDIALTERGAKLFDEVTRQSIGKRMAIVVDGQVVSAPRIQSRIPSGKAQISGSFTRQEAEAIVERINSYREEAREFLDALDKEEGAPPRRDVPEKTRPAPSTAPSSAGRARKMSPTTQATNPFNELGVPFPRISAVDTETGETMTFPNPLALVEVMTKTGDYESWGRRARTGPATNSLGYAFTYALETSAAEPYQAVALLGGLTIKRPDGTTLASNGGDVDRNWLRGEIRVYDETGREVIAVVSAQRESTSDPFRITKVLLHPGTPQEEIRLLRVAGVVLPAPSGA